MMYIWRLSFGGVWGCCRDCYVVSLGIMGNDFMLVLWGI